MIEHQVPVAGPSLNFCYVFRKQYYKPYSIVFGRHNKNSVSETEGRHARKIRCEQFHSLFCTTVRDVIRILVKILLQYLTKSMTQKVSVIITYCEVLIGNIDTMRKNCLNNAISVTILWATRCVKSALGAFTVGDEFKVNWGEDEQFS